MSTFAKSNSFASVNEHTSSTCPAILSAESFKLHHYQIQKHLGAWTLLNLAISLESTTSRLPISNISSEGSQSKQLYFRQQTNGVRRESCHGTPPKCLILGI